MKETSLKLLTLLYTRGNFSEVFTNYEQLSLLLPELTRSGVRSLVSLLKKRGLITTERLDNQTMVFITNAGTKTVEDQIPAFFFTDGQVVSEWSCLVFLKAPKRDPEFRYLRSLLLDHHAVGLTRGVYLYPGSFPAKIKEECHELYTLSVIIMQAKTLVQGDLRTIFSQHQPLADIAQSYSGISSEINSLLKPKKDYSDLNDQQKKHIFSVFNRFFKIVSDDSGFTKLFFPQVNGAYELLLEIQTALSLK